MSDYNQSKGIDYTSPMIPFLDIMKTPFREMTTKYTYTDNYRFSAIVNAEFPKVTD